MGGNPTHKNEIHLNPNPFALIQINVGGKKFTTLYKRLEKTLYFYNLLKSNINEEEIFIDRDGDLFRQVLLFLRNGIILAQDKQTMKALLSEAEFYQCEELAIALEDKLDEKQETKKIGLEFIDLKTLFKEKQDQETKSTYTLIKKTGNKLETYAVVDYVNVFSRNEYKNNLCEHRSKDCGCYFYPKLVLVPQQKSNLSK